eukprot:CAMPEP_0115522154 /NCGR_PEP_ID=MMETSP0271-20121206/79928_1 /TAXON_ID=71861 /ORGANISM="Scrippsiella trochoidea, Strain CCMP3099" /LENGTH=63 /DNA_ID=CAMNT_0002953433 /DNA_START=191 /DNA_END=382 /DNA_ORIENTATION=+
MTGAWMVRAEHALRAGHCLSQQCKTYLALTHAHMTPPEEHCRVHRIVVVVTKGAAARVKRLLQ